jgi:hypothetical protein
MADIFGYLVSMRAETVGAIAAVFGLAAAAFEYHRQRQRARLELGQQLIERMDTDEMIAFAVKSLDWAAGEIPVPEPWRDIVKSPSIPPKPIEIVAALETKLSDQTAKDPVRLLYRHSFVSLFNHLERIEDLRSAGAVKTSDLGTMSWLTQQLDAWQYNPFPDRPAFRPALEAWYEDQKPARLIDAINTWARKRRATADGRESSRPGAQYRADN